MPLPCNCAATLWGAPDPPQPQIVSADELEDPAMVYSSTIAGTVAQELIRLIRRVEEKELQDVLSETVSCLWFCACGSGLVAHLAQVDALLPTPVEGVLLREMLSTHLLVGPLLNHRPKVTWELIEGASAWDCAGSFGQVVEYAAAQGWSPSMNRIIEVLARVSCGLLQ